MTTQVVIYFSLFVAMVAGVGLCFARERLQAFFYSIAVSLSLSVLVWMHTQISISFMAFFYFLMIDISLASFVAATNFFSAPRAITRTKFENFYLTFTILLAGAVLLAFGNLLAHWTVDANAPLKKLNLAKVFLEFWSVDYVFHMMFLSFTVLATIGSLLMVRSRAK